MPVSLRPSVVTPPPTDHMALAKEELGAAVASPIMNTLPVSSMSLFVLGVVTLPLAGIGVAPMIAGAMMFGPETAFKVATTGVTTPVSATLHGAKALYHFARWATKL